MATDRPQADAAGVDDASNPAQVATDRLAAEPGASVVDVAVADIHMPAWRTDDESSPGGYRAFRASIRASGVLEPVLLRPRDGGGLEVVSGALRVQAARETGQAVVPGIVQPLTDVAAIQRGLDALRRTGVSQTAAADLRARLAEGGLPEAESEAILAAIPLLDAGGGPGPASPAPGIDALPTSEAAAPRRRPSALTTAGTFVAVWALVFLLLARILSTSNQRAELTAVAACILGVALAAAGFLVPRRP